MRFIIVVDEQDEYEKWKKAQKTYVAANADYVMANRKVIKGLMPAAPAAPDSAIAVDAPAPDTVAAIQAKPERKPKPARRRNGN
jgi:hypothetical protein